MSGNQLGKIVNVKDGSIPTVPCFPIETLLLALNWTYIDYLSLDVEGFEMPVLKTIPFNQFTFKALTIEYVHGSSTKEDFINFVSGKGFMYSKRIYENDETKGVFADDLLFIKP